MKKINLPAIVAVALMGSFFFWLWCQLAIWLVKHGFGAKWLALLD